MKIQTIQIQNLDLADKFCEDFAYNGDMVYGDSDPEEEQRTFGKRFNTCSKTKP